MPDGAPKHAILYLTTIALLICFAPVNLEHDALAVCLQLLRGGAAAASRVADLSIGKLGIGTSISKIGAAMLSPTVLRSRALYLERRSLYMWY